MAVWLLADAAWLVDSTPVECTRSCESARCSELAVRRGPCRHLLARTGSRGPV